LAEGELLRHSWRDGVRWPEGIAGGVSKFVKLGEALAANGFAMDHNAAGHFSWRGQWGGRRCVVRVAPRRRTRYAGEVRYRSTECFHLRIELETGVRTQLFFVRKSFARNVLVRFLYKLRKQSAMPDRLPGLDGFIAVTVDPAWARQFVCDTAAVAKVAELVRDHASMIYAGSVYFLPAAEIGKLHYGSPILHRDLVTAERAFAVLNALADICRAAERLPPPHVTPEVGAITKWSEEHPAMIAAGILLLGFIGAALAGLVFFGLLMQIGRVVFGGHLQGR
jgi:hypothetical protein